MTTARSTRPTFRKLSERDCRAILARNRVGRIAFSFREVVDIEPIHYVYTGEHIVFRTGPGAKFDSFRHHPWIALEVDEIDGMFDWRSVVVRGSVYRLEPGGTRAEAAAYRRSVEELRALMPTTLTAKDPAPFRDIVMRLYIERLTGRGARDAGARAKPRTGPRAKANTKRPRKG